MPRKVLGILNFHALSMFQGLVGDRVKRRIIVASLYVTQREEKWCDLVYLGSSCCRVRSATNRNRTLDHALVADGMMEAA